MSGLSRIKNVKLHGPIGTYEHTDDNAPLEVLTQNDVILQSLVDGTYERLQNSIDLDFDRDNFVSLLPEPVSRKLYVNPGTFLCRMPTRSGPFENIGRGSGLNTRRGGLEGDKSVANTLAGLPYHEMSETHRSSVIFFQGGDAYFEPWRDTDFNWKSDDFGTWTSDAPNHRIDLVCIQGFPSNDQFGQNPTVLASDSPKLVVVKGAGFRNAPWFDGKQANEDVDLTYFHVWGNSVGVDKYRETLTGNSEGITKAKTYGMGMTSIEKRSSTRTFGTTPAPDDIINHAYHMMPGLLDDYFNPLTSSTAELADAQSNNSHVGLFCVPVAYVKIPKGYSGGTIQKSWVYDIRPFFRSTELTLPERQAVANAHNPEAANRFLTIWDSDYQALVDYVMREDQWNAFETVTGQRNIIPGNHEGRIKAMEAALSRPQFQTAPRTSYEDSIPQLKLRPKYPRSTGDTPVWGWMWGKGPKHWMYSGSTGTGIGYTGDLYYAPGQHIPAVRNYLDRFYSDSYNLKERYQEMSLLEPSRVYGAHNVMARRIVNRRKFLSYNTNAWEGFEYEGGDITEYPAATYRNKHVRGATRNIHNTSKGAKMDDSMLDPNNKYKFQMIEIDFEFPPFDVDRDEHEECEQVWVQSCSRGRGWSGFGHGGSTTCTGKYVTRCAMVDGGKTLEQELPHMGIPLGYVPYWVDVDALGFAPGTIDALQIQVVNSFDTKNDYGTFVFYRFNKRRPPHRGGRPYNRPEDGSDYVIQVPESQKSLDERVRAMDWEESDWVYGVVGETQTWTRNYFEDEGKDHPETNFRAPQVSYGYNGFVLMTNMPIKATKNSKPHSHWGGLFNHTVNWYNHTQSWRPKRCKIRIAGPAHRYFNGAFLPSSSNSDSGDSNVGYNWID